MLFTESILNDLLIIAIVGIMVLHGLRLAAQQRWMAFDPLNFFWLFAFSVYVMQPVMFHKSLLEWNGPGQVTLALLYSAIAMLAVAVGYEQATGVRLGLKLPVFTASLNPTRFRNIGFILICLGLLGYAYLVASAGSLKAWFSVARGGTDYDAINAWYGQLAFFLTLGIILLNFHVEMHPVSHVLRISVWLVVVMNLLFMLYLGTRSRLITSCIMMLAAYYLPRRRNPPWALLTGLGLALYIVANFQMYYRDKFTDLSLNFDQIDMQEARERIAPGFLGGDAAARETEYNPAGEFNLVVMTIDLVPRAVPFNYGYAFLEVFTRPIPRAIWPDKRYPAVEAYQGVLRSLSNPNPATIRDTDLIGGPAFSFVGCWYYAGGLLAVIGAGILTGMFLRMLRTIYDRDPSNESNILMYSQVAMIGSSEAISPILGWVFLFPFAIIPLLLFFRLCRPPDHASLAPDQL